ncbi:hypothetical protein AMTRI_Chr09g15380 [Amborella trichopoda]
MRGKMKLSAMAIALAWLLFMDSTKAATVSSPSPSPAPAPDYVNLTELLSVAGPFHLFLEKLESTKVIDTFQNQANNTDQGITIFAPKDKAFSSLKKPSLSNLTSDQLKSLMLYHAIPEYYSLADFKNLSQQGPTSTFAGGLYALNFTDNKGSVSLDSGWSQTLISSSVYSTRPVALYQVDSVLLPEAIFGKAPPPAPAPAPAPDTFTPADVSPSGSQENPFSPKSSPSTSANAAASRPVAMTALFSPVVALVHLLLVAGGVVVL